MTASGASANSGTSTVREQHRFDEAALASWMAAHIDGYAGPLEVAQFKGGQSNPTYRLSTPTRNYVLRRKPPGQTVQGAHAVDREARILQALAPAGFPVAKVYGLCTDDSVIGSWFYIMELVEGRIFWDASFSEVPHDQRPAYFDAMNATIAQLHSLDYAALGLEGFGKPGNYFERQIARWSRQYLASVTEPIAEMDRLIDWLPAHMPESARDERQVSIVHGDFRLDNLMFHPTEPRVIAVLDWELSTLGHPLADFSYHCMAWHIKPGSFRGIGGLDHKALGIPEEAEYIQRYCQRTGFTTPEKLALDWNFYMAYNLFRIAAILQGIAKRVVDGTASSDQAKASGNGAKPMAELAWHFASQVH